MKHIRNIMILMSVIGVISCGSKSGQTYYDGYEFTAKTEEGVEMLFKVVSAKDKTVQVGNGDSNEHPQLNELAAVDQDYDGKLTIPQESNGFKVVRISKAAFFKCKIERVYISEGIETLMEDAFFDCENLTEIDLPNSLKTIEKSVFSGCSNLRTLHIPMNVEWLSNEAFGELHLEKITVDANNKCYDSRADCNAIIETSTNTLVLGCRNTVIPESITTIGDNAFLRSDLKDIEIPRSMKIIKGRAFEGCKLTSIYIPENVEEISEKAFSPAYLNTITVDPNNKFYDSRNDCNAIIEKTSKTLVIGCRNTIIPSDIITIGKNAFDDCNELRDIIIPMGVRTIGESAFSNCGIKSIDIPSSVKEIKNSAFGFCDLKQIKLVEGIERIGEYAFAHTEIENLFIPASVCAIGKRVVEFCPQLKKIEVAPGNDIFDSRNDCNALIHTKTNSLRAGCMNTIIPDDILKIEEGAFYCMGNSRIVIPSGVKEIEEGVFAGLDVVVSLILEPFIIPDAFVTEIDTLFVPEGTKDKYAKTKGWGKTKNIVELSSASL